MNPLLKYPRTPHLEGSRLQVGDEDLDAVPIEDLWGRHLVIEEKLDGANCGVSFGDDGHLLLQSRGHYLDGGRRDLQFSMLKSWATSIRDILWRRLANRYILFGEWMYAKHTIFYDALPHYFAEFDIWDRQAQCFLCTGSRRSLLDGLPIVSAPVLAEGKFRSVQQLLAKSRWKSGQVAESFREQCGRHGYPIERALKETDLSPEMEGLYVKWEDGGVVRGRYKFVRASFHSAVDQSGSHWIDRPIIPNLLAEDASIF